MKKKKSKKCKHLFIVSGKYFGLFCCPYCSSYFTKKVPAFYEEIRERDNWIKVKLTP